MKYQKNIMVDIETFGTGERALIISIAMVPFHMEYKTLDVPNFRANVSIQSGLDAGLQIDESTLLWWIDQDREVLKCNLVDPRPLKVVLAELSLWYMRHFDQDTLVWGNGPSFDNAILSAAFKSVGSVAPWKHYNERCVRTYLHGWRPILQERVKFLGSKHLPVADAQHQIRCIKYVYQQNNVLP
ncbi:3'-5' exonuclease [Cecembia rubra]|uniref:Uncharacterized protein DUF5051 n=1 Tax=Cecembia rubra TaxID=1485585 RepID=A0A2P8EAQ7_9BACT|nr:3'-5' exonuclease [Cecembia rubra]PSL06563.1 uncharacterized protein DUF5051 [Cecembia rubra]